MGRMMTTRAKRFCEWVFALVRPRWPWLLLCVYTAWLTSPLWQARDRFFAGTVHGDNIVSPWFYHWVSRSVADGTSLDTVSDFNYPNPLPRFEDFPNVLDAVLMAPLWWVFGWPLAWGMIQTTAVMITGLGCAVLARALGCRGPGVCLAGILGVLCRQIWHDLSTGRINSAWPGILLLSVAALIFAVRPREEKQGPDASRRRGGWAVIAGILGATAVSIYPPYLVLFVPAGLVLSIRPLLKTDRLGWGLFGGAIALGLVLGWGEISAIIEARGPISRLRDFSAGCPNRHSALITTDFFRWGPDSARGLSVPGLASGTWMLMGLVVLHERRWMGVGLLLCAGLLSVLALGPCPRWVENTGDPTVGLLDWQSWPLLPHVLPWSWDTFSPITDWGRMATLAALIAAVCAGLGIEALWRRGRRGRGLAVLFAVLAVYQAQHVLVPEIAAPPKWQQATTTMGAAHYLGNETEPVADLPFDSSRQYLNLLVAPGAPRINPLHPSDPPPAQPLIEWLFGMSSRGGEISTPTLSDDVLRDSGLRWVLVDPDRCAVGGFGIPVCSPEGRAAMDTVLGPSSDSNGPWVWRIGAETRDVP